MSVSEESFIILAIISLAVIGAAVGVSVAVRDRNKFMRLPVQGLAFVLIFLGFAALTRTLWWQLSGSLPGMAWQRSPAFYVTVAAWLAGAGFWLWSQRGASLRRRSMNLMGLAALVLVVVGASESIIGRMMHARSRSLSADLRAAPGQVAPAFEFLDVQHRQHTLSEYRGKVVLLNFWSVSCGPCIREMPDLSALQQQLAARGFELILLSADDASTLAEFFASHPAEGVKGIISEERMPALYHANEAWPIVFLIDRKGIVVDTWLGAFPPELIRQRIEASL